jgi:DNA-binding MarR family transcriptional regulator
MTPNQRLLSDLAKTVFRLNGQLLGIGEELALPAGLTAALWQVLATVLREPLPVSEVARQIGVKRQSVQRVADLLVERGFAKYRPNPAHLRAKLLTPTPRGRDAVRRIRPAHAAFADDLAASLGSKQLRDAVETVARLSRALESLMNEPASQTHRPKPIPSATG